jgi:CRISPR system Cascade subunit CasA
MTSFDVLREPWVPVSNRDGEATQLGLLNVLSQAHDLDRVEDPSPLIRFGIYRLLLTFVLDAYSTRGLDDLADMLDQGRFDADVLQAYVHRCGPVFDLFDKRRPFLQSSVEQTEGVKPVPISALVPHLPSGSNTIHFTRRLEQEVVIGAAGCARLLTTIAPFMTAGGAGKSPSVNGAPPWFVLVRGKSLFETLVFNLPVLPVPGTPDRGLPAWRDETAVTPKREISEFPLLAALTWQPRLIRLIPEDLQAPCTVSGLDEWPIVQSMVFGPGHKAVNDKGQWRDPQVPYRITEKGRMPLRPKNDQELWRDLGPLALATENNSNSGDKFRYERPLVVSQFRQLQTGEGIIDRDRPLLIECFGLRTDLKMKIFDWHTDRLSVRAEVLANPVSGTLVQQGISDASNIAFAIKSAIAKAYPRDGKGASNPFGNLVASSLREFWSSIRLLFEVQYLDRVAEQEDGDVDAPGELRRWWTTELTVCARQVLDHAIRHLDVDSEAIRRQVRARDDLNNRLNRILKLVSAPAPAAAGSDRQEV